MSGESGQKVIVIDCSRTIDGKSLADHLEEFMVRILKDIQEACSQ